MKTIKSNQQKKIIKQRLILSELINFKIYNQIKNKNNYLLFSLKETSLNFKKMLQIIFQYHKNQKKILIIGEKSLIKKKFVFFLKKKTNHSFLPRIAWIKGLFSNNRKIKKILLKKKISILKKIKKPRLLVMYERSNIIDIERYYNRRIPNITLTIPNLDPKKYYYKNSSYSIFSNNNLTTLRKKKINFFFSILIEKILKLPKKKNINNKQNLKNYDTKKKKSKIN